ncbi:MAG TPA: hypothetical protein VFJ27_08505, partial [Terriglobia bacterium]|nr:hypothetical protein [Terriglobia bacterium]
GRKRLGIQLSSAPLSETKSCCVASCSPFPTFPPQAVGPSLFRTKVTGVTTVLAVVIPILAKAHLVVRLAKHAKAVALALLLELAAGNTHEHSPS